MNKSWLHIIVPVVLLYYLLLLRPGVFGFIISPIIILLSAFYLCYYLLSNQQLLVNNQTKNVSNNVIWITFGCLSLVAVLWANFIFTSNKVDITKSDIIPLIKEIYYTRFIAGEFVYAHVDGYDYISWTPNYLPLHWLPFVPAFYWGFDPRFIGIFALLVTFAIYYYQLIKQENNPTDLWIKMLLPFVILFAIFIKQKLSAAHTVEFLIAAYYMLLAIGIQLAFRLTTIVGFTTTLLSRYMSVFYLPIDIYLSFKQKHKQSWITYSAIFLGIVILYIIPFVLIDPLLFFKGASAYDIAALGEWKGQSWQAIGDKPAQLFQGFGFASWFYSFGTSDLQTRIHNLKISLILIMIVSIIILLVLSQQYSNYPTFKSVALFILVLLFTSFALVPYNYLFWDSLFLIPVLILPYTIFKWRKA